MGGGHSLAACVAKATAPGIGKDIKGLPRETFEQFLREHTKARKAWERGRALERISLRRLQFLQAQTSPAMAIWLGKQYLGQTDPDTKESDSNRRRDYWRKFYAAIS